MLRSLRSRLRLPEETVPARRARTWEPEQRMAWAGAWVCGPVGAGRVWPPVWLPVSAEPAPVFARRRELSVATAELFAAAAEAAVREAAPPPVPSRRRAARDPS